MTKSELADRLIAILTRSPDQTARELSDLLRLTGVKVTKNEVNAVLYGYHESFTSDREAVPRWRTLPGVWSPNTPWSTSPETSTGGGSRREVSTDELMKLLGF